MMHPVYTCQRIPRELEVTGKVDDPLWHSAEVATLTHPVSGDPSTMGATARLLYTDTHLYVGMECKDDYIHATLTAPDSPVWTEGCFELFLCPSDRFRQYYEINVNPLNTVFATFILNGKQPGEITRPITSFVEGYTCTGLLTRVHVDGKMEVVGGTRGWSVEYRIPFTSIIGADNIVPESGDVWRMNMCRIGSKKPADADFRYFSWATIGAIDFHEPWTYGHLRFA